MAGVFSYCAAGRGNAMVSITQEAPLKIVYSIEGCLPAKV
jgi:hypothetical protein